jgi:hypothetical protein
VRSDELVGRWIVGELTEEIAIEELHTLVGALLKSLLRVSRKNSTKLLTVAVDRKLIDESEQTLLCSLNSLFRNRLKHEAQVIDPDEREEAKETLWKVLTHAEGTLGRLDRSAGHRLAVATDGS